MMKPAAHITTMNDAYEAFVSMASIFFISFFSVLIKLSAQNSVLARKQLSEEDFFVAASRHQYGFCWMKVDVVD